MNKIETEQAIVNFLSAQWDYEEIARIDVSVVKTFKEQDNTLMHHALVSITYKKGNERHTYQDFVDIFGAITFK